MLCAWRDGDADMCSIWLCSRKDAIGNLAVTAAALSAFRTGSGWPDPAVAAVMGVLALNAGRSVSSRPAPNRDRCRRPLEGAPLCRSPAP